MKKQTIVMGGLIIVLILCGVLFWWYLKTKPTNSEIQAATENISTVNANIFTDKTAQKVESMTIFGNVPVQVESNYPHDNLFQ